MKAFHRGCTPFQLGVRALSLALAAVLLAGLTGYLIWLDRAQPTLSRQGSQGEEVRRIQQRLLDWGYFDGPVDGVFGVKTKQAVLAFQQKNGLDPDGIAGPDTPGGNPLRDRWRWGRWCSTGWITPPFPTPWRV